MVCDVSLQKTIVWILQTNSHLLGF